MSNLYSKEEMVKYSYKTDLIDVAYCNCREVDLVKTLCGGVDGGHYGAAVEIRSSSEDKEGCNHY